MEHTVGELSWRKARASGNSGGNCVEVAFGPEGRATGMVRDSKRPEAGHLAVAGDQWQSFLSGVKAGEFDL